jgi:SAM-dependent methyltransferase
MVKYFHDDEHHNLVAPSIIMPYILSGIKPKSVVDIGCGIGTFLHVCKNNGIDDILGIDGEWTDQNLLSKYIDLSEFQIADLESKLQIKRKFDLAICLEVAEHLREDSAKTIVSNLVNLSDIIIFSAAFPGQGGQNHLNEQWPSYWAKIFNDYDFNFFDVLRPIFWENEKIPIWYKQNMFLVVKNGKEEILRYFKSKMNEPLINFVHPNCFYPHLERSNELDILQKKYSDLIKGKSNFKMYSKVITKYFLRKFGLYNK